MLLFPALQIVGGYDQQQVSLEKAAVRSNTGSGNSYWLVVQNAFDQSEKVILIKGFAYSGNKINCEKIRELLGGPHSVHYRCEAVAKPEWIDYFK